MAFWNRSDKEPRSLKKAREYLSKRPPGESVAFAEALIDQRSPEEAQAISETLIYRRTVKLPGFDGLQRGVRDWFSDKKDRVSEIFVGKWRQPYAGANAVVTATVEGEQYVAMGEKPVMDEKGNVTGTELVLLGGHMDPSSPGKVRDRHLGDTALREAIEEAFSYDPKDPDKAKVKALQDAQRKLKDTPPLPAAIRSDYGITDQKEKHSVVTDYLYNLGVLPDLPPIQPSPNAEHRDVFRVHWVPVSQMRKDPTEQVQQFGSARSRYYLELEDGKRVNIRDNQGPGLEAGLNKLGISLHGSQAQTAEKDEEPEQHQKDRKRFRDRFQKPKETQQDELAARRAAKDGEAAHGVA